ncbi:MAG: hypothetical protein V9F04_05470 [Dermatophilaceae bacterium]
MSMQVRTWVQLLPWMTVYAIAMAFLESAVVIDLRALYYPVEFTFPMAPIDRRIAITELLREVATMVMLLAPGAMLTRRALERFAWFIYCFGVWDIFYYVFLKAILDWPVTLLDWDILFLVPVPWVGPVLATRDRFAGHDPARPCDPACTRAAGGRDDHEAGVEPVRQRCDDHAIHVRGRAPGACVG